MHFRTFCVSAVTNDGANELNTFLQSNRILSVERRFSESESKWFFCVEHLAGAVSDRKSKVDYREILNDADFLVFSALRDLRKELAEKEGVPVYAVFTNEQLAQMAQNRVNTLTGLGEIAGVGATKVEKYGEAFAKRLKDLLDGS